MAWNKFLQAALAAAKEEEEKRKQGVSVPATLNKEEASPLVKQAAASIKAGLTGAKAGAQSAALAPAASSLQAVKKDLLAKVAAGGTGAPRAQMNMAKQATTLTGPVNRNMASMLDAERLYSDTVKKLLADYQTYAGYGPQQKQEVVDSLVGGGITNPGKGNVGKLNYTAMVNTELMNEELMQQLSALGMFDDPYYALNSDYIAMPTLPYINKTLAEKQAELAESLKKDEKDKLYQSNLQSTRGAWEQLELEKNNPYMFDPMYGYSMMEYLQGDRDEPFNYDQWDYEYQRLTPEQQKARLSELEKKWDGLDFDALTGRNYSYESQTPILQSQIDMLTGEAQRRQELFDMRQELRSNPDFAQASQYQAPEYEMDPMYKEGGLKTLVAGLQGEKDVWGDKQNFINNWQKYQSTMVGVNPYEGTNASWIAELMQNLGSFLGMDGQGQAMSTKVNSYISEGLHLMLPHEVDEYNVAMGISPEMGERYLELTRADRLRRAADVEADYWRTRGENAPTAIVDTLASFPKNVWGAANTVLGAVTGENDPNAEIYGPSRQVSTTRQAAGDLAGEMFPVQIFGEEAGTVAYNVLTSIGDMLVAKKIGNIAGAATNKAEAAQKVMGFVMATESGANTYLSDLQEGQDPLYAAFHGIANGSIEAWSESGFIDSLFDEKGRFLARVWKSGASEGLEEVVSEGGQMGVDLFLSYLTGQENDIQETYKYYEAKLGKDKAALATLQHYGNNFALAYTSGALAGAGTSAVVNTGVEIANRQTGKAIQQQGDPEAMLEIGKAMPKDSEAYAIAVDIEGTVGKGKKLPLGKLGRLTQAIGQNLSEEYKGTVDRVMEDAITERLVELGTDSSKARKNAPVIRKLTQGEKLTAAERAAVAWDDNADQVTREISREMAQDKVKVDGAAPAEPEGQRTGQKWVTDMRIRQVEATGENAEMAIRYRQAMERPVTKAAKEAAKAGEAKVNRGKTGKPAGKPTAKKVYFDDGTSKGEGDILRFEKDKDGLKMVVQTGKTDKETATVSLDAMTSADGAGTAGLISYLEGTGKHTHDISAEEANTMLAAYNVSGGDVGRFIDDYTTAYLEGYSGLEGSESGMGKEIVNVARTNGQREAEQDETRRKERASAYKAVANPVAAWLGRVDSNAQVKGQGDVEGLGAALEDLTESQRVTAEAAIEFGKAVGLNVVLFESNPENVEGIQNGSFDAITHTVYLDVNSGTGSAQDIQAQKNAGTLGYAMGRTMSHELTHYLEAAAPEAYAKYSQAIKAALKAKGQDFAMLMREKMDRAIQNGRKLTMQGAAAEVIADASEYMLQDSKFTNNLDSTVKGKIKAFIQNFAQKVKDIFRNLTGGHKESTALREMKDGVYHYMEGLQELWDAGFVEILDKGTDDHAAGDTEMVEGIPVEELEATRKFSMGRDVELRDDGLIAMHNLKESDVMGTLDLGGFPMPSIAIVKAKDGHTMYGDYSVLFGKETIDPANKKNRVYGADAWTPVFPHVETQIHDDILYDVQEGFRDLAAQVDEEYGKKARIWFGNFSGSDVTSKSLEDIAESAANNTGVMAAYLADHGETVEVVETDAQVDQGYKPERADQYDKILDIIDMNDYFNMPMHELLDTYGDRLAEVSGQLSRFNAHWKTGDRRSGAAMARVLQEAIAYEGSGRDKTVKTKRVKDYYATDDAIRARVDRKDVEAWAKEKLTPAFGEQGIYNGKDRFTPSGNRRSFKQTHNALTADNVVKSMLTQEESAIPVTDAKGLMAAAASMYKSIAEIKGDANRLGKISEEEYNARIAAADNAFRDFLNAIEAWDYEQIQDVGKLLVQAAKGRMDAKAISALLKRNGFHKATIKASIMAENVIQQVQTIPTGYFEAKPARVVGFDEIRMIVAPDTMPESLATELDKRGIPYTTYDGSDADRLIKINAVEGVRFSDRDLPEGITIRDYLRDLKPTSRMNETEKYLLKKYQEQLQVLEEKEQLVAQQEEIIRTAPIRNPDGSLNDEITKAKNRVKIYRDQANRAARALTAYERDDGFASILATGRQVVNELQMGSAGGIADAADVLEKDVAELTAKLTKLEADVTRTATGQRNAYARGLYKPDDLKAAAQQLKDSYGSRMSVNNIADRLALTFGELYANDGAEGAKMFSAAAKDLALDLLKGNKYRYKSEILPLLREKIGSISLSETDVQEIENRGYTLREFRSMLSPYIKVTEGASDLSSFATNAQYYGEGALAAVLNDDTEGNLAMRLYEVISQEKAKEAEIAYEGMTENQLIGMAMADIAGANLPMSTNNQTVEYLRKELMKYAGENATVAIAVEEAIGKAKTTTAKAGNVWREAVKHTETAREAVEYYRKLEEQRRVLELAEQKKTLTEQLRSDNAQKLKEKVDKQKAEFREKEQKAREYRKTRDEVDKLRRGIGRKVKRLNTLRVRETDQKHVPQELQHVADLVMQTFTDSELGRLAFHEAKLLNLGRTYRLLMQSQSDAAYFWDDEIETDIENLKSLSEAYGALRNRENGAPSRFSLEGVELETEILQGVDAIVSNVLNMIDSTNTAFLYKRNETFEQYANKTGEKLLAHADRKTLKGIAGKVQEMLDETLVKGNTTPVYFFEHLDNQEIMDVFDEIREGQSYYAQIVAEGKDFVQAAKKRHNYGKWVADGKLTMKTSQGHTIELTREEAAEIYAIAKREKANKLYQTEHLLYGGFQYKHRDQHVSADGKTLVKDMPHQLDMADIAKIESWLTAEQKAYADELVGFLSTTMADYGNEASMDMYGYKKFTESYYIPFHTVANQRFQKGDEGPQGENAGTGRVQNSGFTHKVQYKANQPLYVGGLTETVADHIHRMAAYSAMVQPIENMKRLLNHKVLENDGTVNTIRALIGQKYGKASEDYMTQLLKDLNGATQSDQRAAALTDKLVGAFKRGAVMASASVVLQQPTAMARAMALISPKYFAQNPFYRPSKGTWEEMLKHSGTAVIKDMGKFDVGMGLTASQYILDENLSVMEAYQRLKGESKTKAGKAAYDRFMAWLTAAPGVADQWTWGLIWKAVKAEQADLHPDMDHTSNAFLDLVGERFDDVVDHTQVYDSVMSRSNLMRSTNALHKMATSFMSEPTLSLNMLYDALTGIKSKRHTGWHRGRIIGSVVASQVLAGALAALVQAWNDDDDKRSALEKYADRATGNILDNLNPLGMIPYISDIVSLFEGYDVERPDMSVIADVYSYGKTFFKSFEDGGQPTWKQIENFAGTLANLTGVPAKNISREIRRTWNAVFNTDWSSPSAFSVGQAMKENLIWYSDKKTEYYQRIVTAEMRGDTKQAEELRTYMLASKGTDEDDLTKGIRDAYKERYEAGGIEKDDAITFLMEHNLVTGETEEKRKQSAFQYVDKWEEGTTNYSAYNTLKDAYKAISFSEIQKAWKELTNYGYTDEQVKTQSRTLIKELVKDGSLTTGQATQLLRKWCSYKKDSDNVSKPQEWLKDKK